MARNKRQSKILELISTKEIETQEDLVAELKLAKFDITQATISRDIKELGLIKVLADNKKYKYATISSNSQSLSSKFITLFKECIITIKIAQNLLVVKTIRGTAGMISNIIEQMNISQILGVTYGDDSAIIVTADNEDAFVTKVKLSEML